MIPLRLSNDQGETLFRKVSVATIISRKQLCVLTAITFNTMWDHPGDGNFHSHSDLVVEGPGVACNLSSLVASE
jgi:hypothetical protein